MAKIDKHPFMLITCIIRKDSIMTQQQLQKTAIQGEHEDVHASHTAILHAIKSVGNARMKFVFSQGRRKYIEVTIINI